MRYIKIYMLFPVLLLLMACEEWLDVKPKAQVEASELFQKETGFKDALWGIYTQMTSTTLYGRELTFGLVDVIGQVYYNVGTAGSSYTNAQNYLYDQANVEALINGVWQGAYNTIANINNLLQYLEAADPAMFEEDNYNVIKGEALGLRAYLHFDLLRLFAPSPVVAADGDAIPYVTDYSFNTTPQSTVNEVLNKVMGDLTEAARLLKEADPIYTGRSITATDDDGYLMRRYFHLNYYAAKALMARVYLYRGDLSNAGSCANEVIESGKYTWTSVDSMAVTVDTDRDRTFSKEQVFALQVQDMVDNIEHRLTETIYVTSRLVFNNTYLTRVWPTGTHSTDWRRLYYWSEVIAATNGYRFNTKLWQSEEMPAAYAKRMPLIRLPEMYLIAAEADIANSADYLNTIRSNRGVTARVTTSDPAELQREILQEYLREFTCEGVAFYYYKRLNSSTIDGLAGTFNTAKYVLPMPAEEIEFGKRN